VLKVPAQKGVPTGPNQFFYYSEIHLLESRPEVAERISMIYGAGLINKLSRYFAVISFLETFIELQTMQAIILPSKSEAGKWRSLSITYVLKSLFFYHSLLSTVHVPQDFRRKRQLAKSLHQILIDLFVVLGCSA
jgi:hypothetical protein